MSSTGMCARKHGEGRPEMTCQRGPPGMLNSYSTTILRAHLLRILTPTAARKSCTEARCRGLVNCEQWPYCSNGTSGKHIASLRKHEGHTMYHQRRPPPLSAWQADTRLHWANRITICPGEFPKTAAIQCPYLDLNVARRSSLPTVMATIWPCQQLKSNVLLVKGI